MIKLFEPPREKTNNVVSEQVTAKLICVFVFAYADCWFSHGAAHLNTCEKCYYMFGLSLVIHFNLIITRLIVMQLSI